MPKRWTFFRRTYAPRVEEISPAPENAPEPVDDGPSTLDPLARPLRLTYSDAQTAADWLAALADISAVSSYKSLSYDLLDLKPGETLADIGCGVGDDARALAARVAPDGEVIGLDASPEMIDRANAAGILPGLRFEVADAAALPLADASCDAVRADRMLQHLQDPLPALREMRRVLKPGGRLVVVEPDWKTMAVYPGSASPDDDHVALTIFDWQAAHIKRPLIGRRLRALLAEAGFEQVAVNPVAYSTTRFVEADLVLELSDAVEHAAADWPERLSSEDARDWRAAALAEDAAGRFFASAPLYFGHAVAG
ncbi:MAG TPA: methyltransferase domain-containing protein [Ktedonobacterales bacterium]